MENNIRSTIKMYNGVEIPNLGLGLWRVEDETELRTSLEAAFDVGYLHIDNAAVYNNEEMVGRYVAERGNRKEIFVTTKLWNPDQLNAEAAFELSLKKLKMDYVDLYLIHWPSPILYNNYVAAWKSLIKIYESGRAKAIGVSNFAIHHIEEIIKATGFVPHMNQVERHPLFQQKELADYCFGKNIQMTAYSPLGSGRLAVLAEKVQPLADKHNKTVAQIILRWQFQTGWALIPKSVKPKRVRENADIFNFTLDESDMAFMLAVDSGTRFLPDPSTAEF
jgi:diketogulonate reductase-like aldo/keto reductase